MAWFTSIKIKAKMIPVFIMAAVLLAGLLAGCGGGDNPSPTGGFRPSPTPEESDPTPPPSAEPSVGSEPSPPLEPSQPQGIAAVMNQRFTYPDPFMSGATGIYTGDWEDGAPSGVGTIILDSEYAEMGYPAEYTGGWENGAKNGYGIATWSNGAAYEGEFVNNKKHGWGKWTNPDGTWYEGNWTDDSFDG